MGRTCYECVATYGRIHTTWLGARHAGRVTTLRPPAALRRPLDRAAETNATTRTASEAWTPRRVRRLLFPTVRVRVDRAPEPRQPRPVQPSIISSRVTSGFAALLVILVLVFVASMHGASRLADLDSAVGRARDVLDEIGVTRNALREVETARRGYLLTRQGEFLDLYLAAMKDAVGHLDRLRELTADDPPQRRRVDALGPLAAYQLTLVTEAIASSLARPREVAAPALDDGTVAAGQIRGIVAELEGAEHECLRDREAETNARTAKVIRGFAAVALIALLLLGTAYYILDRDAAVHAAMIEELRMYSRAASSERVPRSDESAHD